jgi:CheY-like chemotaxis protein
VFEEFRRGAQAPSNERAGLGLALAIARRFAQVQGGVRSLASRPGRGSVFRLALPGLDAATAATLPAPAPPQGDEAQRLRGLRVLVVDDDAAVRQATALLLQDWGCWPQLLASPDEWDAACTADVTLCDNQFNGQARAHEVAARLAVAPGARLPLVVATGDIAAPNLRLLQDRGALVLAKPLDPLQLRQALLSRCAAGAAAGAAT